MNVTQNKTTHLHVEKKKIYTKQKQKAQECINPFMNLWLKENVMLLLTDFIHSGKGE